MKKLVSFALAIAMLICGAASAFAVDYEVCSETAFIRQSAERFSERTGTPVKVVGYQVEETDEFEIYAMLVEPVAAPRSGNTVYGTSIHSWKDKKTGAILGEIYATAYFEYNGSSAIVTEHFSGSNISSSCSYTITSESWKNSSTFNKAYYKFTYTLNYSNRAATATVEINCTNSGVVNQVTTTKSI